MRERHAGYEEGVEHSIVRCSVCSHYKGSFKCNAFKQIPDEIISDLDTHSKPLSGQKNKVIFEPTELGKKYKDKLSKQHQTALRIKKAGL